MATAIFLGAVVMAHAIDSYGMHYYNSLIIVGTGLAVVYDTLTLLGGKRSD